MAGQVTAKIEASASCEVHPRAANTGHNVFAAPHGVASLSCRRRCSAIPNLLAWFTLDLHAQCKLPACKGDLVLKVSLDSALCLLVFVSTFCFSSGVCNLHSLLVSGAIPLSISYIMAENRGPQLLGVNIAFSIITCSIVLLRCYTRAVIVRAFGADDLIMILATVRTQLSRQRLVFAN